VRTEVINDVLLIEINHPFVNSASQPLRSGERSKTAI
jgi:hypothetical protein